MFCWHCGGDASEPDHRLRCDGRQGAIEANEDQRRAANLPTFDPLEHARVSDPDTSLAAAFSVEDATEVERRVYALFRQEHAGLTDEELLALYMRVYHTADRSLEARASPRKRRSDLAKAGILIDSGERRPLTSGRQGVVWKLAS